MHDNPFLEIAEVFAGSHPSEPDAHCHLARYFFLRMPLRLPLSRSQPLCLPPTKLSVFTRDIPVKTRQQSVETSQTFGERAPIS